MCVNALMLCSAVKIVRACLACVDVIALSSAGVTRRFVCELEVCAAGTYLPSPRIAGPPCVACPTGTLGRSPCSVGGDGAAMCTDVDRDVGMWWLVRCRITSRSLT